MDPEDLQERWKAQGEEIFAAVAQWRAAHPQATLAEIEHAVDKQMHRLRARMIEQAAQASADAESEASQGLVCEQCGQARAQLSDMVDKSRSHPRTSFRLFFVSGQSA